MRLPSDYITAQGYSGGTAVNPLALGGHICRIRNARVDQAKSGKDLLVVAFDIQEGSEWDGYYAEMFKSLRNWNTEAKWPGVFRKTVTNNDGKTNGYFKGFIEAVEKSNPGFDFAATGADETKLVGKVVGFNFGEEEYWSNVHREVRVMVNPQYAVSVQDVRDGIEPPKRKSIDPNKIPQNAAQSGSDVVNDEDYDLPF